MDTSEASKPDRFAESLSSAWASFLGAQHCNRAIDALRRRLDEHIQHATLSIASLQRDAINRQDQISTTLAEFKARAEERDIQSSKETALLRADLSALQKDSVHFREQLTANYSRLSERADAQQETLDGLRSSTAQDIWALEKQHRSALKSIEILQRELRETKEEKTALEQRLAVLNDRVTAIDGTPRDFSEETVKFLESVFSRRHELMRLLDTPYDEIRLGSQPSQLKPIVHNPQDKKPQHPASIPAPDTQPNQVSRYETSQENASALSETKSDNAPRQLAPPTRRAQAQAQPTSNPNPSFSFSSSNPPQDQAQTHRQPSQLSQPQQDIRALCLVFRDRYKVNPPKSDTAFIWEFLSAIENPAMAEYVQESLAVILPEYVSRSRDTRRRNPRRHVTIARGLTWRRFREALVKIPVPG